MGSMTGIECGFKLTLKPHKIQQPRSWKEPSRIFVNSMSDLFHEDVPDEYLGEVFDLMNVANWHQYQVLTKRTARMRQWVRREYSGLAPGPHIWLGTSIEDSRVLERADNLRMTSAAIRFLSIEPLIGCIDYGDAYRAFQGIDWIIIGGESGPGARPLELSWIDFLMDAACNAGCAVFVKQLGSVWARENGAKHPKGGDPEEWPEHLRVREFPEVRRG